MLRVCCAHLLRELNGIAENHPEQAWARKFKEHLLRMKRAKDKAIAAGKDYLSVFTIQKYKREYDDIIKEAYAQNPIAEPVRKKRGRVKRGKILALIDRLKKYKGAVCLFLEKLGVPFISATSKQRPRFAAASEAEPAQRNTWA